MSKNETYEFIKHDFSYRVAGKPCCIKCGLFDFNNEFTRWAIDKGCLNQLHSQYQNKRSLTNPFKEV